MCKAISFEYWKGITTAVSIFVILGITSFQSVYAGCGSACSICNGSSSCCSTMNTCNPPNQCTWTSSTSTCSSTIKEHM